MRSHVQDGFHTAIYSTVPEGIQALFFHTECNASRRLVGKVSSSSTAYAVVKKYEEGKVGKFPGVDIVSNCPSIGRSSALAALKKLTDESIVLQQGTGRGTYYVRVDSIE